MAFRLKASDYKILEAAAEHRIMTVAQMSVFFNQKKQALWRRLRDLEQEGFLVVRQQEFGRGRGRPQKLVSLGSRGVDILKENQMLGADVSADVVMADNFHCVDHQLMLNWLRLHLNHITVVLPRLSIRFLSHSSPFLPKALSGHPLTTDFAPVDGNQDEVVKFIPDGVFSITDSVEGQTLLYFLEVDCGTETIASLKRKPTDIRQKILNYGAYFDSQRYKRYEKLWNCELEGFRLLFVANTLERLACLCKLIREMPPSDYIWLTEQRRIFPDGISAKIWARGGNIGTAPESILDALCCRTPLPC